MQENRGKQRGQPEQPGKAEKGVEGQKPGQQNDPDRQQSTKGRDETINKRGQIGHRRGDDDL